MQGFLSWFGARKKENIGVLYIRQNEVDFLFFRRDAQEVQVMLYGTERAPTWNVKEAIHKVLQQAEKQGKVRELMVTFPPYQFWAHMIEEQMAPTNSKHVIEAKEAHALESEIRSRVQRLLQKRLFQETGILPSDFALRRILVVERAIDGYRVPSLQGYKRGEITFSLLGLFLLEPPFLLLESVAKRHNVEKIHVLHMGEAIWQFAKAQQKPGVYLTIDQEHTQVAVWKEQRFRFCGVLPMGASDFLLALQKEFGLQENIAREFANEYARGKLSEETRARIHAAVLPELKKFGTIVKKKLAQTGLSLPAQFWVFGETALLQDIHAVFGESLQEDLAFLAKPALSPLLPVHIWEHANFLEKQNPLYTPLCMLGAASFLTSS